MPMTFGHIAFFRGKKDSYRLKGQSAGVERVVQTISANINCFVPEDKAKGRSLNISHRICLLAARFFKIEYRFARLSFRPPMFAFRQEGPQN
jgi:hypothetical protein